LALIEEKQARHAMILSEKNGMSAVI
jgi:hypothetical protein